MRNGARFSIRIVNNGIILSWRSQGLSALKEPYKEYQGVYVFKSWEEVTAHIQEALS